ncbi:MAG TPA: maleylpyruvate isomerase N-terminal domain-containing protein [Pseudonocardiaceae bacterium]|nr:maleylpyruvate isomerase N-terminal domain-containing protein [Pseudonocardiaceae bacterium]
MTRNLDYIEHLTRESARFGAALRDAAPDARVPTCPDWDADDLLWHLGHVQWWWATIVRDGVTGDEAEQRKPERPTDREKLFEFQADAGRELIRVLAERPPDSPTWTWGQPPGTTAFVRRRQAHEAFVHRLDAELTAGNRTAMDTQLASDGVDETLRVMYSYLPSWGTFTPEPAKTVRMTTTDTDATWLVTLGRFTGTDDEGTAHDEPDLQVAAEDPGGPVAAECRGEAVDLLCWLVQRPALGDVVRTGDQLVLEHLYAAVAPGV